MLRKVKYSYIETISFENDEGVETSKEVENTYGECILTQDEWDETQKKHKEKKGFKIISDIEFVKRRRGDDI